MTKNIENLNWTSGSGVKTTMNEISCFVKENTASGAKIYIGTDSFVSKSSVIFASAICLYQKDVVSRYFFSKTRQKKEKYESLINRLLEETKKSIEIGVYLNKKCQINSNFIELHLDISPFHLKNATSKFSDMLKAYAAGSGFNCKLKPDAWASQSVADRHSK